MINVQFFTDFAETLCAWKTNKAKKKWENITGVQYFRGILSYLHVHQQEWCQLCPIIYTLYSLHFLTICTNFPFSPPPPPEYAAPPRSLVSWTSPSFYTKLPAFNADIVCPGSNVSLAFPTYKYLEATSVCCPCVVRTRCKIRKGREIWG